MNNQELELRIKEILKNRNFFDMIESAINFEKEYKTSDFFRKTKISLMEVIKEAKTWYITQLDNIGEKIQELLDNLDVTKVNSILTQLGNIYTGENEETMAIIKEFKELVK